MNGTRLVRTVPSGLQIDEGPKLGGWLGERAGTVDDFACRNVEPRGRSSSLTGLPVCAKDDLLDRALGKLAQSLPTDRDDATKLLSRIPHEHTGLVTKRELRSGLHNMWIKLGCNELDVLFSSLERKALEGDGPPPPASAKGESLIRLADLCAALPIRAKRRRSSSQSRAGSSACTSPCDAEDGAVKPGKAPGPPQQSAVEGLFVGEKHAVGEAVAANGHERVCTRSRVGTQTNASAPAASPTSANRASVAVSTELRRRASCLAESSPAAVRTCSPLGTKGYSSGAGGGERGGFAAHPALSCLPGRRRGVDAHRALVLSPRGVAPAAASEVGTPARSAGQFGGRRVPLPVRLSYRSLSVPSALCLHLCPACFRLAPRICASFRSACGARLLRVSSI